MSDLNIVSWDPIEMKGRGTIGSDVATHVVLMLFHL